MHRRIVHGLEYDLGSLIVISRSMWPRSRLGDVQRIARQVAGHIEPRIAAEFRRFPEQRVAIPTSGRR
jgi:hypothetical protein